MKFFRIVSAVFWFIRQFLLPNPFEILGEGFVFASGVVWSPETLNIVAGIALPSISFGLARLHYHKASDDNPAFGSLVYMVVFIITSFAMALALKVYPSGFRMALVGVAYVAIHALFIWLRRKLENYRDTHFIQ